MIRWYIVLKVRADLFAIPALHPENGIELDLDHSDFTVILKTTFPDALPPALPGTFIAYIHWVLRDNEMDSEMILVNSIHLSTKEDSWI